MSLLTGVVVSLFIIFITAWGYILSQKNKNFFKSIPGPPPLPIFGNTLEFKSTTTMIPKLMKFTKQYGGIFKLSVGPFKKMIVISDYKLLEGILSSTNILSKAPEYAFLHSWLGTGLLTSTDDKWRKHRRILTPAFHFQILEQFLDIFHAESNILIKKLQKEVENDSVDIYPYITLCALDIISESAMDVKINAQNETNSAYVQSVKTMCRIVLERTFRILEFMDITYVFTANYRAEKKSLKVLHSKTNQVIKEKQALRQNLKNEETNSDSYGEKKRLAFLDLLLQATKDGRPLTQEEIREEVDTFMFEGHDTTASAMSFALYSMAYNPKVQEKVFEEQKMIFGNNPNPVPTYSDLQDMKYLELVIKETLRMYPTVPFYGRETTKPVILDGKRFPAGVTLSLFAYGIHYNPEYYEKPEVFNPDRWETNEGKLPYAFIPFSAGPRNCIGQKFAMLEMKSTLSKVIRNYKLDAAKPYHNLILASEAVLKSANGIKISLKARK